MGWLPRLLERAFWFPHVSCWGSRVQSNQSRVTQRLRVRGLMKDQSRVTQATMWWHSLVRSMSLLCRFCVPLVVHWLLDVVYWLLMWCTYCWICLLWLFTFIDDDWWFMDDVLLTCGSWIEVDIFRWLYLMILVFDLYLVHVWCLVTWCWYWIECSFFLDYFIFLSSMCYLWGSFDY